MPLMNRVLLSEKTYQHYKTLIWLFRFICAFPFNVMRDGAELFLVLSPKIMACGFIYGAAAIFMAYWGVFDDLIISQGGSIKASAAVDKLMLFNVVTSYTLVFFCGVCLNPCRFIQLFNYIQCINKVDSVVESKYNKLEKYKLTATVFVILFFNLSLATIDLSGCYITFGDRLGIGGVLKRYLALNVVGIMCNLVAFTYRVMITGLKNRFKWLNRLLELELKKVRNSNDAIVIFDLKWKQKDVIRYMDEVKAKPVCDLAKVYLLVMDAADALNTFLGPCTVIMVLCAICALIDSPFLLLVILQGKRGDGRGITELPLASMLLCLRTLRVLLLTESSYECIIESENTKRLVCHLLSSNVNKNYRKQVQHFAAVIGLRPLSFSACGFFTVDRTLFTSVLDTITTVVMISLQFHDEEVM